MLSFLNNGVSLESLFEIFNNLKSEANSVVLGSQYKMKIKYTIREQTAALFVFIRKVAEISKEKALELLSNLTCFGFNILKNEDLLTFVSQNTNDSNEIIEVYK